MQTRTRRTVAIKMLSGLARRDDPPEGTLRARDPHRCGLRHPNIVTVHDSGAIGDGRYGLVMEYIDGVTLDRWSRGLDAARGRDARRLALRERLGVMSKVCDAVLCAHQHSIVHRDLKPANILVDVDGEPHVLDFGIARDIGPEQRTRLTHTGEFTGTLAYASPEQVSGDLSRGDTRTDIYSLGVILYELVSGRMPYEVDGPMARTIRNIESAEPEAPTRRSRDPDAPWVDDEVATIVLKAMAKEPARRYQSAAALRDDIDHYLAGEPIEARRDSTWYVLRKTAWRYRTALVIVALAGLVLASIVVLGAMERVAAVRAELAAAVRDARTRESHFVVMAEARSTGRDNFTVGERLAWNAFLRPEAPLVDAAIEGPGAMWATTEIGADEAIDAPPTSPAYWALWDMYARTPIVASSPVTDRSLRFFDESGDHVFTIAGRKLQWWDWRSGRIDRETELPAAENPPWTITEATPAGVVVSTASGPALLVDPREGRSTVIDRDNVRRACASGARLAGAIERPDGSWRIDLWDDAQWPARFLAMHELPGALTSLAIDRSGDFVAASAIDGSLIVVDARTGELLLRRTSNDEPRFVRIGSRGKEKELVAWAFDRCAVLDFTGDWRGSFERNPMPLASPAWSIDTINPEPTGTRYAVTGTRHQIGIGDVTRPAIDVRWIPGVTGDYPALSPDQRHLAMALSDGGRMAVMDLASPMVRRLPHPAEPTTNGFATIFDLEFEPDGRFLRSAAMDGSARRYAVADGTAEVVVPRASQGGITRMALVDGAMFLGSHELGWNNAEVVKVGDGVLSTLTSGPERWFCGLVAQSGGTDRPRLWALSGAGHLIEFDPVSGTTMREAELAAPRLRQGYRALAGLPGPRLLLAGSRHNGLHVLDEDSLEPVCDAVAMSAIQAIEASPVATDRFVTTHDDGTIRLWRVVAGRPARIELVREIGAHAGVASCAAFHPAGRLLATGGGVAETKDVRIWDTETGHELAALDLFELGVFALAFSPDGRWLAAGGEAESARPEAGGQLFLIDLRAPDRCIAGNLEYHLDRLAQEGGPQPDPGHVAALRARAARLRGGRE
ncbi:MAG: WD40 repeat domain-containing serine/threonine-protein kinase [Phycisphaerales bacterium]